MIKKRFGLSLIAALILVMFLATGTGFAANPPGVSPEDAKKFMPVSQIKRGMRGYGLTVFQGTTIEKFDVEILGILKQMNTGKDLIMLRAGGGPITKRNAGIIAGMSGSPIYINGKLVGAISYGAGFAKEPVGMATPIADMLEAWDDNLPKHASGYSSMSTLAQPVSVAGKSVHSVKIDGPGDPPKGIDDGVLHMQPLMMPLMVSGLSQRGMERLSEILRPYNIRPMAGPGGGAKDKTGIKATLQPGAAVGVSLARGDIDLTGVGTLTYRRGNKVVGFGHPMLSIGAIDAPMTTAYVEDVLSSYQVSTKLATPIETVGRIFQDRPWSVAGAVGDMPKTIPVKIQIDDKAAKRNRTFRVNVINHPLLASRLITMIVAEAMFQSHPAPGDATASMTYEINADQVGKIKRSNVFFDGVAIDSASISDIGIMLMLLGSNRFHPLDIKSVDVNVQITDKRNTAQIDRIFVKESEFEPGQTVEVGVVLRPYKKDRITKTYNIKIPATAPNGKLALMVRGGASSGPGGLMGMPVDDGDEAMGGGVGIGSELANADNVKQLVNKYLERERNNEVIVQLMMRSTAVNVAGEKLTGLPSSIADVMKSSRNSGLRMEREEVKERFIEDMIVQGAARLTIDVKRKDMKEGKVPPRSGPPAPDMGDSDSVSPPSPEDFEPVSYDSYGSGAMLMAMASSDPMPESGNNDSTENGDDSSEPVEEEPSVNETSKSVESETTSSSTTSTSKAKTVVRQVKTWTQNDQAGFAKGAFSGVSASSDNKLVLAPTLKKLVETPEQYVWCVAPGNGGVYAGTGNSGKIYHISESGEMKLFYETGELQVHSLIRDAEGNLYAGTSPNGKVFKITPDGKGKMVLDAEGKYILALAIDRDGNVYAGTGDAGKIYRIAPDGSSGLFSQTNEQQILSLHWNAKTGLIAGTGIGGVVYKIDASGKTEPIYNAAEGSVTSVAVDREGNVYAGASPKGAIYKISPDGRAKTVFPKAARVLSMVIDQDDNLYAVSDGTLVKITPDETVVNLDSSRHKVQFLALGFDQDAKALYAGTGNIGSVYISKCCDVIGTYESAIHDTKMVSRWGRIRWITEAPEGTSVTLETRTGNVPEPDNTWSVWSTAYTDMAGTPIAGGNARYIQYRVTLTTQRPDVTPKVSSISLTYLTPNQAPVVKLTSPVGGEVLSGKSTIRWTGSDPDKDVVTYDVYFSKDGGKDWQTLVGGMTGPANGGKSINEKEIRDKVKAEVEKSPDIPDDIKQKVLKEATTDSEMKPNENSNSSPSSTKTTYDWDTAKVEDGKYMIKIVASDKTSNATDALTKETISDPFIVCNTPPELAIHRSGKVINISGAATVTGSAKSKLIDIAGVQYRVDGGDWIAAAASDGVFDSPEETFELSTGNLTPGTYKIEIQAIDAAGNAKSETVEVKVS